MSILGHESSPTSNDLLRRLVGNQSLSDLNYEIIAQSVEDVQNIENAPAVSMGPYLLKSGQVRLLTTISIYSLRGENHEQVRLLYMNAAAIQVWKRWENLPKSFVRGLVHLALPSSRLVSPSANRRIIAVDVSI
jgi:hypothetical protein